MNSKHWFVAAGLMFVIVEAWGATGSIHFQGRIVESGCVGRLGVGAVVELHGCPTMTRDQPTGSAGIRPVGSVTAVGNSNTNVKLKAESGHDDRFVLVDALDRSVQTGTYIVTLTAP